MNPVVEALTKALETISDIASARMRTKSDMATAIDEIGLIAAEALRDRRNPCGPVEAKVRIGDSIYEVDVPYRRGAQASRDGERFDANPYDEDDDEEAHAQWRYGHENEEGDDTKLDYVLAHCRIQT